MTMRVQSIRFAPFQWDAIAAAADDDGVAISQLVRDAAYAHALLRPWVKAHPELWEQLGPRERAVVEHLLVDVLREA